MLSTMASPPRFASRKRMGPDTPRGDFATTSSPNIRSMAASKPSLARRPNHGSVGDPVKILANHYLIEFTPKLLYHYDVTISPDVPRGLNRAVMTALVAEYRMEKLGGALPAYDGQKSLYTAKPLPIEQVELDITLPENTDSDGPVVRTRKNRSFHVILREASRVDLAQLRAFLEGTVPILPQKALQALDIVLRESATKRFLPGGRSFFDECFGNKSLGNGVMAWKGFYQSVRPAQNGKLILNIDISANAFLEPDLLPDYIAKALRVDINEMNKELQGPDGRGDASRVKIKKLLKGVRVELIYGTKRKYRIQNVTNVPLSELSFDHNGTRIGIIQYFRERHNHGIILAGLPAIEVGTKEKSTYIPMELCRIVRGQRHTKKLNEAQVDALLRMTCSRPADRLEETNNIAKRSINASATYAEEFGIRVSSRMAEITGRILPAPKILYGQRQEVLPEEGWWKMNGKTMFRSSVIKQWTLISFAAQLSDNAIEHFISTFVRNCIVYGLDINPKMACPWIADRRGNVEKTIHHICKEAKDKTGRDLELLICILPTTMENKAMYGAVKKLCDVELGFMTQCLKSGEALKKCLPAYVQNVILKINMKLGGNNALLVDVNSRPLPLLSDVPSIVIGADVSHPRVGDDRSPSIAAVVASMDWPNLSRYETLTRSQAHRTEILDDLYWERVNDEGQKESGGIVMDLLASFARNTGKRPQRILFYRDGVSDGQFEAVMKQELESVKAACQALGWVQQPGQEEPAPKKQRASENDITPKITFIVVQKQHHTRLFPRDRRKTQKTGNIFPGTVVDSVICHPTQFDFFLCSHLGIQGTSRPAHYHVVHDENSFSADQIQKLTNDLCHNYARCPRAVSIVPACYYAHLAATRARIWIDYDALSDGGSSRPDVDSNVGSNSSRSARARGALGPVRPLPVINEKLKRHMYFI